MRAAQHARTAPAPAEPGTAGHAATAVSEARQLLAEARRLIALLRRDPASRDNGIQLIYLGDRIGEFSLALVAAAEADREAAAALRDFTAAHRQPPPEPPRPQAPRLRVVRSGLLAALPVAGLGVALRAAFGAPRRAAASLAGTVLLAGGMTAATVQMRTVPSQAAIQHVQLAPAAARPPAPSSPAAGLRRPRSPRTRRPHRAPAVPVPVPSRTRSPRPPVPSPSPSGDGRPGTIQVASTILRAGPGGTAQLVITCTGGACDWTATADSGAVILHQAGGHLEAGQAAVIPVTVTGYGWITISPGDVTVRVMTAA